MSDIMNTTDKTLMQKIEPAVKKITLMLCGAGLLVVGYKFSGHYEQYKLDRAELATVRQMDQTCDENRQAFQEVERADPAFAHSKPIYWHCKARWWQQEQSKRNAESVL